MAAWAACWREFVSPCMCISERTEFPENSSSIKKGPVSYSMLADLPARLHVVHLIEQRRKKSILPTPILSDQPHT